MTRTSAVSRRRRRLTMSRRIQAGIFVSVTLFLLHQHRLISECLMWPPPVTIPQSSEAAVPPPVVSSADDDICRGYDGVLRIRAGDEGAAFGAVFFIYVVNHLLFAEMHNLLPWIHLDGTSHRIYDTVVHGSSTPDSYLQTIIGKVPVKDYETYIPLGPLPVINNTISDDQEDQLRRQMKNITLNGNGVWESYFYPVSKFSPLRNRACTDPTKPLYDLDEDQIGLGIHSQIDWGVRAWPYGIISDEDRNHTTLTDWYRPQRRRAATIVRKYYRPKDWLLQAVEGANPLKDDERCVAMHVRTTDKELSGGRYEVELKNFLPHVERFLDKKHRIGQRPIIYLASDSHATITKINDDWPPTVVEYVRMQSSTMLSSNETPTFDLGNHHRTNMEVLIDIYAMAKCEIMIHGRSAVSEAVMYLNPDIRERSIDLDQPDLV